MVQYHVINIILLPTGMTISLKLGAHLREERRLISTVAKNIKACSFLGLYYVNAFILCMTQFKEKNT